MELTNELLNILLEIEKDEYTEPVNTEQYTSTEFWCNTLEQFEEYTLNDEDNYCDGILM